MFLATAVTRDQLDAASDRCDESAASNSPNDSTES
jgi:hypothetical protein